MAVKYKIKAIYKAYLWLSTQCTPASDLLNSRSLSKDTTGQSLTTMIINYSIVQGRFAKSLGMSNFAYSKSAFLGISHMGNSCL